MARRLLLVLGVALIAVGCATRVLDLPDGSAAVADLAGADPTSSDLADPALDLARDPDGGQCVPLGGTCIMNSDCCVGGCWTPIDRLPPHSPQPSPREGGPGVCEPL
jgi:hypothetical protein